MDQKTGNCVEKTQEIRVCDENYIKLNKFALAMKICQKYDSSKTEKFALAMKLIRLSVQCQKMGKNRSSKQIGRINFPPSPLETCSEKVQPW
jgi:hypothetical protein